MNGDKSDGQVNHMLQDLKHRYAVVSVNYRLSGERLFPKNINDIKSAIRWANAATHKMNPDKIVL